MSIPIPSAALFLIAAAVASSLFPGLAPSIGTVETIGKIALVVILFDGGASIGLRRFRAVAGPIASLGVIGTFATAGAVAVFAHWVFSFGWVTSGLLAAAIAPTDPAVMFSVLGGRDVGGRIRTLLEGESGANDPVGIALMLGMIELATHHDATAWVVVRVFCEQMAIGLAIGVVGGLVAHRLPQRLLWLVALVGVLYLSAVVAHGSGFLAVFVAGVLIGDREEQSSALQDRLATLAEVVVFVALGLTIELSALSAGRWAEGVAFAAFTALVARPLAVAPLLAPTALRVGEILFVVWGGLKGAVPILLAAFALGRHVPDAERIYEIVFVVVLVSVVVQGGTLSLAARRLGVATTPRA